MHDKDKNLKVAIIGLGPMGMTVTERLAASSEATLTVAADPAFAGDDVFGTKAEASTEAITRERTDVAMVATSSQFTEVQSLVLEFVKRGIHVVSTCEELAYPWLRNPELARELDAEAIEAGVAVVGTGVNPGFVMDALPSFLATAGAEVRSMRISRAVNLSERRPQLREKMGAGVAIAAWEEQGGAARFGHKGLEESAALCGLSLGWPVTLQSMRFQREPHVADGVVQGLHEAVAWELDGKSLNLSVDYRLESASSDKIEVVSTDGQETSVEIDGLQGDTATIARAYNALFAVSRLSPGLRLPLDLPARSR